MNNNNLSFVKQWKYLGVMIKSDHFFACSAASWLSSFYRSTNTVLNVIRKPSEHVMLNFLYSMCIPIMTYACEVKVFSSKEMTQLHVACNDEYGKYSHSVDGKVWSFWGRALVIPQLLRFLLDANLLLKNVWIKLTTHFYGFCTISICNCFYFILVSCDVWVMFSFVLLYHIVEYE